MVKKCLSKGKGELGVNSRKSRGKYLAQNTLIFTLGNIGSRLISFFLLPLYTNCLTTGQYGTVDLITTIATVAVPMITLDIGESLMRFGLDKNTNHNENTQISLFIFIISVFIAIPLCLLLGHFANIGKYSMYILMYMISLAAYQISQSDLRGKELLLQYSIASILETLLVASFNILFLLIFHFGIGGYLLAYGIANLIAAIYCVVVGKSYVAFGFHLIRKKQFRDMVSYSFALIPNTFMWWITDSSDRILVTSMIGASANGIYAVSYKLPTIVSAIASVFNQAWLYSAVREQNANDEVSYNNMILRTLTGWSIIVGLGVLAFTKPFLKIFVAPNYYSAWKYTPFLIIGVVYMTLGTFMATSYTVHKDSLGFLISGMFGAIVNVILNLLFIKPLGVYGSALATCISYLSVFIFRYFHTRKYLRYSLHNKEFILGSLLLLISSVVMFINNFIGLTIQAFILLLGILFFSRDWTPILNQIIHKLIRK